MKFTGLLIVAITFLYNSVESIQNGDFISIKEAPYYASIIEFDEILSRCGAAILSKYWLVTAAHCIKYSWELKDVRTGSTANRSNGTRYDIDHVVIPDNYTHIPDEVAEWISVNDIGLIKLKQPIEFNEYQQPIKLRSIPPKENDTVIIVGLGYERVHEYPPSLKKTVQSVLAAAPSFAPKPPSVFHLKNSTSHTCPGDSGSPGVIDNELAGILVFGHGGCSDWYQSSKDNYPGALTRVDMFYHWILNQTGIEYK